MFFSPTTLKSALIPRGFTTFRNHQFATQVRAGSDYRTRIEWHPKGRHCSLLARVPSRLTFQQIFFHLLYILYLAICTCVRANSIEMSHVETKGAWRKWVFHFGSVGSRGNQYARQHAILWTVCTPTRHHVTGGHANTPLRDQFARRYLTKIQIAVNV